MASRTPGEQLPLRVVLVAPPRGVRWALQEGRDTLVEPLRVTDDEVVLATTVLVKPPAEYGTLRFGGPAAQGPPSARFLYANSGTYAGNATSSGRRAKIPLASITPALLDQWRATPNAWLEARIAGTAR